MVPTSAAEGQLLPLGVIDGYFDLEAMRSTSCHYFDSAGRTLMPRTVEAVGERSLRLKRTPWLGMGPSNIAETIRTRFGALIGTTGDNIAIMPSTGFAMTLAAHNIARDRTLRPGDRILVLHNQMASNVMPWQFLAAERGLVLEAVAEPADGDWTRELLQRIDATVRVVALPVVQWGTGIVIDVKAVRDKLKSTQHAASSYFVIDGTQSIGAMPFNVHDLRPDYVAASVHKWLCSPYGAALVYVDPALHARWQPLDQHERNRAGSDQPAWDEVGVFGTKGPGYPTDFVDFARRFDCGGRPNPITYPMLAESLRLVLEWDPAKVDGHAAVLAAALNHGLDSLNAARGKVPGAAACTVVTCKGHSNHIVGVRILNGPDPAAVGAALKERNIHLSVRSGTLRVAMFVYTGLDDIAALVSGLDTVTKELPHASKL